MLSTPLQVMMTLFKGIFLPQLKQKELTSMSLPPKRGYIKTVFSRCSVLCSGIWTDNTALEVHTAFPEDLDKAQHCVAGMKMQLPFTDNHSAVLSQRSAKESLWKTTDTGIIVSAGVIFSPCLHHRSAPTPVREIYNVCRQTSWVKISIHIYICLS